MTDPILSARTRTGAVVAWCGGPAVWVLDPPARPMRVDLPQTPTQDEARRVVARVVIAIESDTTCHGVARRATRWTP